MGKEAEKKERNEEREWRIGKWETGKGKNQGRVKRQGNREQDREWGRGRVKGQEKDEWGRGREMGKSSSHGMGWVGRGLQAPGVQAVPQHLSGHQQTMALSTTFPGLRTPPVPRAKPEQAFWVKEPLGEMQKKRTLNNHSLP